jgi:glycosyltransferase involved in cell wall biosynthesis
MSQQNTMETDTVHTLSSDPRQWRMCVVLPTRNEAATLASVVQGIRTAFAAHGLHAPHILVADDSHDDTRSLARRLGLTVVIGGGKGLGYAMYQGLKAALSFAPDVVVSMDADGQSDPHEILRFLEPIAQDKADMVVGSRFLEPDLIQYRYRWRNRFGIFVLVRILRALTGLPLTDSHGGLRAMRPEVVQELDVIGTHTYVQETLIDAREKGFRITEVPSIWHKRTRGSSQVVGSIPKYVMYTLPILIIRSGVHIRWLYSFGGLLIISAFVYFGVISWESGFRLKAMFSRLPSFVLIALLITVGLQLFMFGFLVELIKNIKARVDRLDRLRSSEPGPTAEGGVATERVPKASAPPRP